MFGDISAVIYWCNTRVDLSIRQLRMIDSALNWKIKGVPSICFINLCSEFDLIGILVVEEIFCCLERNR